MNTAKFINSQYGQDPDQNKIYSIGNDYLKQTFPGLDYISTTSIDNEVYNEEAL
jgi:hypothetical protein